MNVDFGTKDLQTAVKGIRRIFDKGPTADKNSNQDCLVASEEDGTVVLESANQGLYTRVKLNATIEEGGRVVINRDYFSDIKFMGQNTVLMFNEGDTKMKCKSGQLNTAISVSQDFDEIEDQRPIKIPDTTIVAPCDVLKAGVKRVSFGIDADEKHKVLKVQLIFRDNRVIVSANDSYRAALFSANVDESFTDEAVVVIPAPFLSAVLAAIPSENPVGIGVNDNVIRIVGGNLDVCHPVMQDTDGIADVEGFVRSMGKEEPIADCIMNVAESKEAISGVASIVPSSLGSDVRLNLLIKETGKAVAKVETSIGNADCKFDIGNATVSVDEPFLLSTRYILEFLSLMGEGDVVMRFWERQVVLRSEQFGTTLVMPQLS